MPAVSMPDTLAGYIIQHRFRIKKGEWPLIQIGPGIITVNDTEGYRWEDFNDRVCKVVRTLFEIYPKTEGNLKVNRLLLRYIDSIKFDFDKDNILTFLKQKMHTKISFYDELFENSKIGRSPLGLDLRFSFPLTEPKGVIRSRFARGKRKGSDALIWETMVESGSTDAPNEIFGWTEKAHELTDEWFFKLIEGELLRRFE